MAFPTVAGHGGGNSGGNVTTTTVDLAALTGTPGVGDMLLVTAVKDGTGTFTWPDGWTVARAVVGTTYALETRWRVVASGDPTSIDITHASEGTAHQAYRISAGTFRLAPPGVSSVQTGTNNRPDPPSAPSSLGPFWDYLWIAIQGNDGDVSCSSGPTNYTNFRNDRWANADGSGVASARRELTASSEDADAFTLAGAEDWASWTIGIASSNGFPVVHRMSGANSGGNVTTSSVDVAALVGTPDAGDLVIISIVKDGTGAFTWPATPAFTQVANFPITADSGSAQAVLDSRYRIWQSGDSTTVSITHANESTAWEVVRIAAGTFDAGTAPAAATTAPGASTDPNPPNLDPAGWATEKTLWLAVAGNDGNVGITAGPSGYFYFRNDRVEAATGAGIAIAWKESEAASEDPGVFTMNSEQWGSGTIAIRPAAGGTVYDETGRALTALALVALTDIAHFKDLSIPLAAVAVVSATDVQHYQDLGLAVPLTAVISAAEAQHYLDTGLAIPVTGLVSAADALKFTELGLASQAVGVVSETDEQAFVDAGLVVVDGQVMLAEALHALDLGLAVTIVGTASAADVQQYRDAALAVNVAAAVTLAVEQQHSVETLEIPVTGVVSATDAKAYKELGLAVTAVGVVVTTDEQAFVDAGLVVVDGQVTLAEALHALDLGLAVTIVGAASAADVQTYQESGLAVNVNAAVTLAVEQLRTGEALTLTAQVATAISDLQHFKDLNIAIPVTGVVTAEAALRFSELGLAITALGVVSEIDAQHFLDAGIVVDAQSQVTLLDALHAIDLDLPVTIVGTATAADLQAYREALAITAQASAALTDLQHFKDLAVGIPTTVLVDITDTFHGTAEALSVVVVGSVNAADFAHRLEAALPVEAQAFLALTDQQHYAEALASLLAVTVTAIDAQHYRESLEMLATGEVVVTDAQRYREVGLLAGILAIVQATDELRAARLGVPLFSFSTPYWSRSFRTDPWDRKYTTPAWSRAFTS